MDKKWNKKPKRPVIQIVSLLSLVVLLIFSSSCVVADEQELIEELLKKVRAKQVVLSYSSGGRATASDLNDSICQTGKVKKIVEIDYKQNVMAGMKWTNEWVKEAEQPHREFLFLIEKR